MTPLVRITRCCRDTRTGERLQGAVWSIPAELLENLGFSKRMCDTPHMHGIGYKTKHEASRYMSSPIIKHFLVSLFVVVHASEYASISWHRAQGAFIHQEATAERCIVMCPLEKSWYRGFGDNKKTRERDTEPHLIEAYVSEAPWAYGCLGEEEKERFLCNRDVKRAQQRRERPLAEGCMMPQMRSCQ